MTLLSYIIAIVLYCIVKSDGRDNPPNLVQTLPKSTDTLFLSVLHHYTCIRVRACANISRKPVQQWTCTLVRWMHSHPAAEKLMYSMYLNHCVVVSLLYRERG